MAGIRDLERLAWFWLWHRAAELSLLCLLDANMSHGTKQNSSSHFLLFLHLELPVLRFRDWGFRSLRLRAFGFKAGALRLIVFLGI